MKNMIRGPYCFNVLKKNLKKISEIYCGCKKIKCEEIEELLYYVNAFINNIKNV